MLALLHAICIPVLQTFIYSASLLLALIVGWFSAGAQSLPAPADITDLEQDCGLTLSGKVLDHDTREALVGATVHIPQLGKATVADAYGNYHFHHLCQGTYTLRVSYVGFEEENFVLKLTNSSVRDLQLHTAAKQLSGIEIVGTHVAAQAQSSQTLAGRQLEETRGLSLGESLKRVNGVTTIQTGPTIAKPVIHGLHSNRILLLNNGVRQEGQQWGAEHAPEIDPFVASEMKVIKGAASVRYGADALGGVVLVEPKPLRQATGVGGEVNLLGTTNNRQGAVSAMAEGKTEKLPLSWRLQGTLKKAGNAKAPGYYLNNTGFTEHNFSAALGYTAQRYGGELFYSQFNTKLGILRDAHIGNLTDLNYAIERGRPINAENTDFTYNIDRPYQDVSHHLFKAKGFLHTGEAGQLEVVYGWQRNVRDEYDVHRSSSGGPALHLDISTHTTEAVWKHKPVGNFSGAVGLSTIYQNNTYKGRPFIPFYKSLAAGAFAIETWRKDRLQLEGGLRYDYKNMRVSKREQNNDIIRPEYNFHNLSGSLGALYDVGYHLTFGLNASSAWRAPGVNELFSYGVHHASATFEIGNANLVSEQAYNFEASVDYYGNRRLNGKLSVYHNYIDNYIYLAPVLPPTLTIRGAFPTFAYKQVNATFSGLDLSLDFKVLDRLQWASQVALVRARNLDTDDYLVGIPADRFDNTLRYALGQADKARFSNSYLSLGGLYVARQTRVPAHTDQDYAPAPGAYFLLHAAAGTTLHLGKQPVEIGLTGHNLLNTSYRDYLNRFRYFTDEMGRLLMLRVKLPLGRASN